MSRPDIGPSSQFEEAAEDKLWRKVKENPFMPLGIVGALSVVGYQLYNFRFKSKNVPLSLYLIRTRVFAQGMIVGAITIGVGSNVAKHFYQKWTNKLPEKVPAISSNK